MSSRFFESFNYAYRVLSDEFKFTKLEIAAIIGIPYDRLNEILDKFEPSVWETLAIQAGALAAKLLREKGQLR